MTIKKTIDDWRAVIDEVNEQTLKQRNDESLREENARLRKALEFYANDATYEDNSIADNPEFYKMPIAEDGGHIAREALGIDD